ncbi:MAG: PolC-type DNA polymerase III [Acutalibacteraceae bacterium]
MGVFSALFGPPAPTSPSPEMRLLRYFCETSVPPTDYTVLDLETSGLDACTCEILEIGAIRYRNHRAIGRYHTFVRPEGFISREASRVNHITWSTVCKAPYFSDVSEQLIEFLGDDVVVGFNVSFDMRFLQTRLGKGIKNPAFDVLSFVKEAEPNLPHYKLGDLRRHFHVGGVPHTALGDCMATAKIFQKCLASPAGIIINEAAVKAKSEYDRQVKLERENHQKIMDRKANAKKNAPPASELAKISLQMTGAVNDYFSKIEEILLREGVAIEKLMNDYNRSDFDYLRSPFGVKLVGKFRYLLLRYPPEVLECGFPCAPSSLAEGEESVRIFVSSPEDLECLTDYIVYSANRAIDRHNSYSIFKH